MSNLRVFLVVVLVFVAAIEPHQDPRHEENGFNTFAFPVSFLELFGNIYSKGFHHVLDHVNGHEGDAKTENEPEHRREFDE